MRTLVTGATGFVGPRLVRRLVERGDQVRVLVRASSNLAALEGLPIEVARGDVTAPETLRAALDGIETVYHAAGLVSSAHRDRQRLFEVNVGGTRNVLSAALAAGASRVIYTSSCAAVGYSRRSEPVNERSSWVDFGVTYARAKRAAEAAAFELQARGLPLVVVNPTTAMGPDDPTMVTTRVVAKFMRGHLPAQVAGGMNIIDVDDFVAGHLLADERGRIGERYILAGTNVTWAEFFRLLSELTGRPVPRRVPLPAALALAFAVERLAEARGRPPRLEFEEVRLAGLYRFADATKARTELGLTVRPLRDTLARTVDWLRPACIPDAR